MFDYAFGQKFFQNMQQKCAFSQNIPSKYSLGLFLSPPPYFFFNKSIFFKILKIFLLY